MNNVTNGLRVKADSTPKKAFAKVAKARQEPTTLNQTKAETKSSIKMLRIVDFARRCEKEWYEVLRNVISNETPPPVVIPTQGEIAVLKVDENQEIEVYPGAEYINLAYEECELNPVSIARIIHAKFPVIFRSYVSVIPGCGEEMGNNVFDFDDIPLRPKTLYKY